MTGDQRVGPGGAVRYSRVGVRGGWRRVALVHRDVGPRHHAEGAHHRTVQRAVAPGGEVQAVVEGLAGGGGGKQGAGAGPKVSRKERQRSFNPSFFGQV